MSFFLNLASGILSGGFQSMFGGEQDESANFMADIDAFVGQTEQESKKAAESSKFQLSELDAGQGLLDILRSKKDQTSAEKELALFTGEAASKKKFKALGEKISKGKSLDIFDFI